MPNRLSILYVDDEVNNLIPFKAHFRKEYHVHTVSQVSEAYLIMMNHQIDIIISDQRMPLTSGIEFLESTIEQFPDAIRLLVTGYSNIDVVIEAINKGQITKYINKPWDWDLLTTTIDYCADLYRARKEIKNKNERLQKTNDELNKFVYSVSHDIRAPLASILGVIQLARLDGVEDENIERSLDNIETNIVRLDDYVTHIIAYYQNSKAEEVKQEIDFKKLMQEVLELIPIHEPNTYVRTDIVQDEVFWGDYFRLRIIFGNLIANALKYKNPKVDKHDVFVEIRIVNGVARILISDNGIGIKVSDYNNIFKMFYRVKNTARNPGSGIGLYIVKEALDKIKGSISVKSALNEGTTFEVEIPSLN